MSFIEQGPTHLVRGQVIKHQPFGIVVKLDEPGFWFGAEGTVVLGYMDDNMREAEQFPAIGSRVQAVTIGFREGHDLRLSMRAGDIDGVRRGGRAKDSLA